MKHALITIQLIFIISSFSLYGQNSFNVLFVNDNSVFSNNTDTVLHALNATGLNFDIFDARDSLRSPNITEMVNYDLLIWYCSTDGVGNFLWNGNDTDNTDLMAYMETGGYLWVMGNDFLYDRYAAPHNFSEGDFVYDYLGTWEYHAQSYGDDGGTGVAELNLTAPAFSSLNTIQWIFPTAWWVDACVPVSAASSIYEMGPDGYALADYSSAIGYASESHFAVTLFFDPALIITFQDRLQLFSDILNYFTLFSGNEEIYYGRNRLQVFPNPIKTSFSISLPEEMHLDDVELILTTIQGKLLNYRIVEITGKSALIQTDHLIPGLYLLRATSGEYTMTEKIIVD